MITRSEYLRLCAEKPDMFGLLPDVLLDEKRIEELRQIPRVAVAEIPGHGRLEPLLATISLQRPDALLPTIAYTGTEYGSWDNLKTLCASLKKNVEKKLRIYCAEPVILGSPRFWWALNGRYMHELSERFGRFATCYGCRLYAFALRIPLCRRIEAHLFMPDVHGQYAGCSMGGCRGLIKYSVVFMAGFGIDAVYTGSAGTAMVSAGFKSAAAKEEKETFACCITPDSSAAETSSASSNSASFLESYAIPAVARIISKTLAGASFDYAKEVQEIFLNMANNKK
jgi:hypothetical protein